MKTNNWSRISRVFRKESKDFSPVCSCFRQRNFRIVNSTWTFKIIGGRLRKTLEVNISGGEETRKLFGDVQVSWEMTSLSKPAHAKTAISPRLALRSLGCFARRVLSRKVPRGEAERGDTAVQSQAVSQFQARGGGYSWDFLVRVCHPVLKIPTRWGGTYLYVGVSSLLQTFR